MRERCARNLAGKFNSFARTARIKMFFCCEIPKTATKSGGVFIISSFANHSENQWVVFTFAV